MSYLNVKDILNVKLNKKAFSKEEIFFLIKSYRDNLISDAQMSAIITSVFINHCNNDEIFNFTQAVIEDSDRTNLKKDKELANAFIIDKHSTGGIGDKISLIFAPIIKSFPELYLMKISGRALGRSGGTIDKLESFENFRTDFTREEAISILKSNRSVIMESNPNWLKAEKKLFTLRDEVGVVASPALIVPSVMCKKLVFDTDLVLLDIKTGSGALLNNLSVTESKIQLADRMLSIAKKLNRNFVAILSNMDIPLGNFIGNNLEVYESIKFLSNQGAINPNLKELVYKFVSIALIEAGIAKDETETHKLIDEAIASGRALASFKEIVIAQHGIWKDDVESFINAKYRLEIKANEDGFINFKKLSNIFTVVEMLGGARHLGDDPIDHSAGIQIIKHQGTKVKKDDIIAILYSAIPIAEEKLITAYYDSVSIKNHLSDEKRFPKTIHHVLYSKNL